MARNRANIEPGQTAYVGNLRFGPGQLLPPGTVEYQVKGWRELDPSEQWQGGPTGVAYSFTVPVGTTRADVQEMADVVVEFAVEEEAGYGYPDLVDQASLFTNIG